MTKKYSAIILGLGRIGFGFDSELDEGFILTHARALLTHGSFELLAGIDPSPDKRNKFESSLGIKSYPSVSDLDLKEIDIAVVATPTNTHIDVVSSLTTIKPKLILMEKPCGQSLKEANAIKEIEDDFGASIVVNYMRRYDPAVISVRKKIESGEFGSFIGGNVLYSKGLGHNGSHYLSLILDFFGDPSKVTPLRYRAEDDFDFSLDWKSFGVTFRAGIEEKASLGEIDLLFENARVRFEQFGGALAFYKPKEDPVYAGYKRFEPSTIDAVPDFNRYQLHVYEYVKSLMPKLPSSKDFEHALLVHKWIEKVRASTLKS